MTGQLEHQTMNTIVHAAFRRDLARFDTALAAFPAGSRQRAEALGRAWDFLDEELHHHHTYEEVYFWPALQQTDADVSALTDLAREHEGMRAALAEASEAMKALRAEPRAEQAATARAAVARLAAVLLAHLAHEEADLEPVSAAYRSSKPMKAALTKVKKAHLRKMGGFVVWLQDGAGPAENAALRREMPAPVIAAFSMLAGGRYRRQVAPVWAATSS